MATNYPSGLDTYTNPAGTDALSTGHASQHANVNDAVEAIEAELGTTPSGSAATVKARFEAIETNDWVTTARIANSQVTSAKIADATITGSDIATGTVTSTNILDGTVTGTDIASGTVTSTNILDATITGSDIASGTITSTNILDGTIVDADINASAAIVGTKLADGAITPIKTSGGYVAKTALYTATNDDRIIDCTTGTYTITLPTAASQTGRRFVIRNSGTGTITIGRTGAETIAGATSQTLAGYGHLEVISNGTNWLVLRGTYSDETVGRRIFTWNSAYSSGAGGWQMTMGNTGWRDVSANINSGNGFTGGSVYIRRTGYNIAIAVFGLTRAAGGAGDFYTFPSGFRAALPMYGRSFSDNAWYVNGASSYINMAGTSEVGAGCAFGTSDSWPTSLPGSAVESIPT